MYGTSRLSGALIKMNNYGGENCEGFVVDENQIICEYFYIVNSVLMFV